MMKVSDVLYNRKEDFIDYICYYKDISSTYRLEVDSGADLKELHSLKIFKYCHPNPCECCVENLKDVRDMDYQDYRRILKHTYGHDCNRFRDFDEVLNILNGLNLSYCIGRQKVYIRDRAEKRSRSLSGNSCSLVTPFLYENLFIHLTVFNLCREQLIVNLSGLVLLSSLQRLSTRSSLLRKC